MIDSYRMAQKLHGTLLRETAKSQQKIVMMKALQREFGLSVALPVDDIFLSHNLAFERAADNNAKLIELTNKRIKENIEIIMELEKLFKQKEEMDMEEFAKAFAERIKRGV